MLSIYEVSLLFVHPLKPYHSYTKYRGRYHCKTNRQAPNICPTQWEGFYYWHIQWTSTYHSHYCTVRAGTNLPYHFHRQLTRHYHITTIEGSMQFASPISKPLPLAQPTRGSLPFRHQRQDRYYLHSQRARPVPFAWSAPFARTMSGYLTFALVVREPPPFT